MIRGEADAPSGERHRRSYRTPARIHSVTLVATPTTRTRIDWSKGSRAPRTYKMMELAGL